MKFLAQSVALMAIALSIGGCVEISAPLCTDANRSDVLSLEGLYQMRSYSMENLEMESSLMNFERRDRGVYSINGESAALTTCQIDGAIYAQVVSENPATFTPYRLNQIWSESGHPSVQFVFLGSSLSLLRSRKIPYKVEETKDDQGNINRRLVISNETMSPSEVAQVLDPMSMSFTFTPVHSQPGTAKLATRAQIEKLLRATRP